MGGLFSKPKLPPPVVIPPPPPEPEPLPQATQAAVPIPDAGDPVAKEIKKKAAAAVPVQRGGRASTILSDRGDTLG